MRTPGRPREGKGFVFLAIDTTPGHIDTQPFPSAPAELTYQAIYCVADNRAAKEQRS